LSQRDDRRSVSLHPAERTTAARAGPRVVQHEQAHFPNGTALREVTAKGKLGRFKKTERGLFAAGLG
jgi:hypothetical protein